MTLKPTRLSKIYITSWANIVSDSGSMGHSSIMSPKIVFEKFSIRTEKIGRVIQGFTIFQILVQRIMKPCTFLSQT